MRGQSAVEYLLVFSTMLMLFASVTMFQMITPVTNAANDTRYLSQARSAVDIIGGAIDTVYSNGPGAVKSVSFPMDEACTIYFDNTENNDNTLRISVGTSNGTENVEGNLQYEIDNYHTPLSLSAGTYTVIVSWPENSIVLENINGSAVANMKIYIYIVPRGR